MINFLLEESIISVGTVAGFFTAHLLNSLKTNIVEPIAENIIESKHLDKRCKVNTPLEEYNNVYIKWQTFLRDFITWLIIITILYFVWNKFYIPYKNNIVNSAK